MLDHLALVDPVDVNDGFAARIVREAMPQAVENDVVSVGEDALDLAMSVRTIGATNLRRPSLPSSMRGLCWR